MPKRSNLKRDFMEVARGSVEQAIGEQMEGSPLTEPEPDTRNPHAVALGSMGGTKDVKARKEAICGQTEGHRAEKQLNRVGVNPSGTFSTIKFSNLPFSSLKCGRVLGD
jgi:hypothetical protein